MTKSIEFTNWVSGPVHISLECDERYGAECIIFYDDQYVLSGGDDQCIRLWDIDSGKQLRKFEAKSHQGVECLALSSCNKYLAAGYGGWGGVHLWEVESAELIWNHESYMYIESIGFSKDDSKIFASLGYANYLIFDRQSGEHLSEADSTSIDQTFFSEDCSRSYELSKRTLSAFTPYTGSLLWTYEGIDKENLRLAAYNTELDCLALAVSKNTFVLVDGENGAITSEISSEIQLADFFRHNHLCFLEGLPFLVLLTDSSLSKNTSRYLYIYNVLTGELHIESRIIESLPRRARVTCLAYNAAKEKLVIATTGHKEAACYSFDLNLNAKTISKKDLREASLLQWKERDVSPIEEVNREFAIGTQDGYWYSETLEEKLSAVELSLVEALAEVYCSSLKGSRSNPIDVLNKCLHFLKNKNNALCLEIAIQSLYFAMPSANRIIHDPWGNLIYYFDQACEYLQAQDLSQLSESQKEQVFEYIDRATEINFKLEELGSKALSGLSLKLGV